MSAFGIRQARELPYGFFNGPWLTAERVRGGWRGHVGFDCEGKTRYTLRSTDITSTSLQEQKRGEA
jgi:hypothetical protein